MKIKEIAYLLLILLVFTLGVVVGLFGPGKITYLVLVSGSLASLFFTVWLILDVINTREINQ